MKANLIQCTGSADVLQDQNGDRRFYPVKPEGNRAQRREAVRQAKLQTRARRKPIQMNLDTLGAAKRRATRLTDEERAKVMVTPLAGFTALREGVATWHQWSAVATAVRVAQAIEAQGVVRGISEHLQAAEFAIDAIFARVADGVRGAAWGKATTLYFDEIAALREALHLHDWQLQHLSFAEFDAAYLQAQRHVLAAGGVLIPHQPEPTPEPVQEILL